MEGESLAQPQGSLSFRPVIQPPLESFFSFFAPGISQTNILVRVKVPQVATRILIYPQ